MKQFYIALVTLAVMHSLVSFGAYRVFTTQEVVPSSELEKRTEFSVSQTRIVIVSRPAVIVWYMWSGYIGLAAAFLCAIYDAIRNGHY
ncbi:hypothetical protein [Prosthecobacter sp.]|uniref:hypothetical protein n=1 Tax=Prosthecobacter sp. TaxID=1965333 RepID=UPI0037839C37